MARMDCSERRDHADRLACVDLPAWPLQILLRRQPAWREGAAAVTAEDSPQAPLLWVNEAAMRGGVLPGMRYATALSLDRSLRAGTVSPAEITAANTRLHRHLLRFSPRVEPAAHEPGVFWLDARGLVRLHGSLARWAERLQRRLVRAGFAVNVAVGFGRFGSYCLARTRAGVTIAATPADERRGLRDVPLARLRLDPRLRDDLRRLGVVTVGELIDLPAVGVGARFGEAAAALHRLARGDSFAPLQPQRPPEAPRTGELLDEPETDAWRLLFLIKRLLHPLLPPLADRGRAVSTLHLELKLADRAGTRRRETLEPAAPTLDAVLLLELVRLRLERLDLAAGIEQVTLTLADTVAPSGALDLFGQQRRRNLTAADRALARVRAELGDQAVVHAELQGAHRPEARFRWTPLTTLPAAAPRPRGPRLVRRLRWHPQPVAAPRSEDLCGGPYLIAEGWWRGETRRIYLFAAARDGALHWLFYDPRQRRWYRQGGVE